MAILVCQFLAVISIEVSSNYVLVTCEYYSQNISPHPSVTYQQAAERESTILDEYNKQNLTGVIARESETDGLIRVRHFAMTTHDATEVNTAHHG